MNHSKTIDCLNELLCNLHVLNVKLHNFHWNVKGLEFMMIHKATEAYYDYCFAQFDDVAERILQLEGKPIATTMGYIEKATIHEDSSTEFSAITVLTALLADFGTLHSQAKAGVTAAEEQGDSGTVDMLSEIIDWLEKEIWILKSSQPR